MAALLHHAGVVDQQADGAEVGRYLGDQRGHGGGVAQVGHVASGHMALAGQVKSALIDPRALRVLLAFNHRRVPAARCPWR